VIAKDGYTRVRDDEEKKATRVMAEKIYRDVGLFLGKAVTALLYSCNTHTHEHGASPYDARIRFLTNVAKELRSQLERIQQKGAWILKKHRKRKARGD
jgi:hypothetical protein